jgi:hypothetical protein
MSDESEKSRFGWISLVKHDFTDEDDGRPVVASSETIGVMTSDDGRRSFTDAVREHLEFDYTGFNSLVNADCGEVVGCPALNEAIPDQVMQKHGIAGIDLWIDGEGALKQDKKLNTAASVFAGTLIYGNVIVMGHSVDGNSIPLPFSVMLYLKQVCDGLRRDCRSGNNERVNEFMQLLHKRHDEWMAETNGSGIKVTVLDTK